MLFDQLDLQAAGKGHGGGHLQVQRLAEVMAIGELQIIQQEKGADANYCGPVVDCRVQVIHHVGNLHQ
ncbi:hypothetical protein D3C80_2088150 [compost metagenome]